MKNFDEKVWNLMKEIPKGKVTTYKIIAEQLGSHAYRAVGNACRRNPYAPEVPCHRVVKSNGKVGGFGGKTSGEYIKRKIELLTKEGVKIQNRTIMNFEKIVHTYSK